MDLSVLDQSMIVAGRSPAEVIRETVATAQACEAMGYRRFWVSEHHGSPGIAGSAPEVLLGALAMATRRIRIGSAGVMLPHYAPLKVATHGPLFRYERPQKGRFRQFHQLDAEIIGAAEPGAAYAAARRKPMCEAPIVPAMTTRKSARERPALTTRSESDMHSSRPSRLPVEKSVTSVGTSAAERRQQLSVTTAHMTRQYSEAGSEPGAPSAGFGVWAGGSVGAGAVAQAPRARAVVTIKSALITEIGPPGHRRYGGTVAIPPWRTVRCGYNG